MRKLLWLLVVVWLVIGALCWESMGQRSGLGTGTGTGTGAGGGHVGSAALPDALILEYGVS